MTGPLVLIVEDEAPLVAMLRYNLEKEGFEVGEAADGEEALVRIAERKPDVVLLDWMLPLVSGIEVCRQIRRSPQTRTLPVIMLTARGEEADRVRGLDSGADDYIAKPFSVRELTARLRAVIRRAQPNAVEETLKFGDVTMDLVAHRVSRVGRPVHLGPTEFRLLRHLMQHPGRVFSREQLLDAVWGHDVYVEARTVDVHIRRLRKALNGEGGPDIVRTGPLRGLRPRPHRRVSRSLIGRGGDAGARSGLCAGNARTRYRLRSRRLAPVSKRRRFRQISPIDQVERAGEVQDKQRDNDDREKRVQPARDVVETPHQAHQRTIVLREYLSHSCLLLGCNVCLGGMVRTGPFDAYADPRPTRLRLAKEYCCEVVV